MEVSLVSRSLSVTDSLALGVTALWSPHDPQHTSSSCTVLFPFDLFSLVCHRFATCNLPNSLEEEGGNQMQKCSRVAGALFPGLACRGRQLNPCPDLDSCVAHTVRLQSEGRCKWVSSFDPPGFQRISQCFASALRIWNHIWRLHASTF